jgi:hypothetical protein
MDKLEDLGASDISYNIVKGKPGVGGDGGIDGGGLFNCEGGGDGSGRDGSRGGEDEGSFSRLG